MVIKKKINSLSKLIPTFSLQSLKKENIVVVSTKNLSFSLNVLKNHISYQYKLLACVSGIDFLNNEYRFCICYDLLSIIYNARIRVKVFISEIDFVPSATKIFINANWWEREIWDLFGIYFSDHSDLRRILTDYGFEGHPMRKDFPLYGYVELRYSESKKRIITEPVQLPQDFRNFTFETPW